MPEPKPAAPLVGSAALGLAPQMELPLGQVRAVDVWLGPTRADGSNTYLGGSHPAPAGKACLTIPRP